MAINLTTTRIRGFKYDLAGSRIQRKWDAQVPGLGIEIFQTGRKSWLFRYKLAGKQFIIKIGDVVDLDLYAAREKALSLRKQVQEGINPKHFKAELKAHTVQALLDEYIATPYFKSKSKDFQRNFPSTIRKHLIPVIGGQPIKKVKRPQIRSILDNLIQDGKEGAARGVLTHARILFNYAAETDQLDNCPTDHIKPKYTTSGKRVVKWTHEDIREAWHLELPQNARLIVRWCLLTGCRRDEARKAAYTEFEDGIWTVARTKSRADEIKPLILPVMPMMEEIIKASREPYQSQYLFPSVRSRTIPTPRNTVAYQLREAVDAKWSLHHLRHVVETNLAELGVVEETRDLILNHTRKSTGSRYNHSTAIKIKKEALSKWHLALKEIISI